MNKHKIAIVLKKLKKAKYNSDIVSPNFVAEFSYNRKIYLTSSEVIYISKKY